MRQLLFATVLLAATPLDAATLHVRAGTLVDVLAGRVLADQLVTITDGRITAVRPFTVQPSDGRFVDWSAYQLLPGLIDMHTHLADYTGNANPADPLRYSAAETALMGAENARVTLNAGFTTVHDVGCYRGLGDVALRNAINAGYVPGPRMNVVGGYLTTPGGGGALTGIAPDVGIPPDFRLGELVGASEARMRARMFFQRGADSLKLIATGAVLAIGGKVGQVELTEEEMRAAVEEARSRGSYATAHAHGADGIKTAIRAGVRSIEHASLVDDEGLAMAKKAGVWLVMDIYNGDYINDIGVKQGWPAEYLAKNIETTEVQRAGFRKAVAAGVRLAYGTDAGVYPHGDNARQFAYMVRYGMTPMQAIQSATISAAELLGWERDVGAIAPGRYGDLVAVKGDATRDVRLLERVDHVVKGGEIIR